MSRDEALRDVTTRRLQLEAHILGSTEYLQRAHSEVKRRITYLYAAIGVMIFVLGCFFYCAQGRLPQPVLFLISITALLSVANCILLIQTKECLHRLNEKWLQPHERETIRTLRSRHQEILAHLPSSQASQAELN